MQETSLLGEIHQMEALSQGISESINYHHILDSPEGPVGLSFTDISSATGIAFQNTF